MSEAPLSTFVRASPRRRIVTRLAVVGVVLFVIAIVALVLVQMRFAQQNGPTDGGEIYLLQIAYVAAPGILAGGLLCLALAFAAAALPVGFGIPAADEEERDDEGVPETIGSPTVPSLSASADPRGAAQPETYDPAAFRRPSSS